MTSHPTTSDQLGMLPCYISTREASQVLAALFLFTAAVSWLAVGYDFAEIRLSSSVFAGVAIEPAERLAHGITGAWVGMFQIVCFAMTGLAFMGWLYRARVNIRAMGMRRMQYRREWVIFGFMIPVLNLLRPYQIVREVWQASDPSNLDPMGWKEVHTPPWLSAWWLTFLVYLALEIVSAALVGGGAGMRRFRVASNLEIIGDISAAISASLAYFVVMGISENQDMKRALRLRGMPSDRSELVHNGRDALA